MSEYAGKTNVLVGTRIRTTKQWDEDGAGRIVEGEITHPFVYLEGYGLGAVAGIWIDLEDADRYGIDERANLFPGDWKIID